MKFKRICPQSLVLGLVAGAAALFLYQRYAAPMVAAPQAFGVYRGPIPAYNPRPIW